MFGWSKWEKFQDRLIASNAFDEKQLHIVTGLVKERKLTNKRDLVDALAQIIRVNFGTPGSKKFERDKIAANRWWETLQTVKDRFVDANN